jgi:hypothetical protein
MGCAQNLIKDDAFVERERERERERRSDIFKKSHLMVQRNLFFEHKHVPGVARGV